MRSAMAAIDPTARIDPGGERYDYRAFGASFGKAFVSEAAA